MKIIKRHCEEPRSGDAAIQVNNVSMGSAIRTRLLRRAFALLAMTILFSAPAVAKVCMLENPTVTVTHAQLAELFDVSECEFDVYTPHDVGQDIGAAWGVSNSGNAPADVKCTVAGIAMCSGAAGTQKARGSPSGADGRHCWCKMTAPRAGAWVFWDSNTTSGDCNHLCAYYCAIHVRDDAIFRAAVLVLP